MTDDGTKMVTGSQYSDLDESNRGSVHFYDLTSYSIIQKIHGDDEGDSGNKFGVDIFGSTGLKRDAIGIVSNMHEIEK